MLVAIVTLVTQINRAAKEVDSGAGRSERSADGSRLAVEVGSCRPAPNLVVQQSESEYRLSWVHAGLSRLRLSPSILALG